MRLTERRGEGKRFEHYEHLFCQWFDLIFNSRYFRSNSTFSVVNIVSKLVSLLNRLAEQLNISIKCH